VKHRRRPRPRAGVASRSSPCGSQIQIECVEVARVQTWQRSSSRWLSQSFATAETLHGEKVMVLGSSRKRSRSFAGTERWRAGSSQQHSQGFAATETYLRRALTRFWVSLRLKGIRNFFLHSRRWMEGGSGWRDSVPMSRANPSDVQGSQLKSSLRGSAAASPTTERCACIMRRWPVPVRQCRCAAVDTGLTEASLSIGQGRHSSSLRASRIQFMMLERAK
jgi:hypothetical protein